MEMYQQMEILRQRHEIKKSNLPEKAKNLALRELRGYYTIPNQLSNVTLTKRVEALESFAKADTEKEFVDAIIDHHLRIIGEVIRMSQEWSDLREELEQ